MPGCCKQLSRTLSKARPSSVSHLLGDTRSLAPLSGASVGPFVNRVLVLSGLGDHSLACAPGPGSAQVFCLPPVQMLRLRERVVSGVRVAVTFSCVPASGQAVVAE